MLGSILPGIASVLHAVWYFSGTLAVLILRKPGAAVYVNVVGSAVEMLLGNNFAFGFVFISAILQGVFAEIPFAATRYRVFNLPMAVLSGLCTALEYGFYLLFFRYQGVALLSPRGIVHMISELVGGALIAGVFSWLLFVAVAKTGATSLPAARCTCVKSKRGLHSVPPRRLWTLCDSQPPHGAAALFLAEASVECLTYIRCGAHVVRNAGRTFFNGRWTDTL